MTNYAERRATVVVFLSARSGTAQPELPVLNEMNSRLRQRGVLFVGVYPNAEETGAEVRQFVQSAGLLFPHYRDPKQTRPGNSACRSPRKPACWMPPGRWFIAAR